MVCRSTCRRVCCTDAVARTAPGRPRRCRGSPASCAPPTGGCSWVATTCMRTRSPPRCDWVSFRIGRSCTTSSPGSSSCASWPRCTVRKAARLLKDIFRQFVERNGTVLMSTHTLEVAEAMCDRVAILQHGKIVAEGTVDDLRQQHRAGDASLEELFLKLTGGAQVRDLVEVLGGGNNEGGRAA